MILKLFQWIKDGHMHKDIKAIDPIMIAPIVISILPSIGSNFFSKYVPTVPNKKKNVSTPNVYIF